MKNNECEVLNNQKMVTKEIISRRVEPTPWPKSENEYQLTQVSNNIKMEGRK